MQIGYARVSSVNQDLRLQLEAFRRAGIRRVHYEKRSGVAERPELRKLLRTMRAGDVLVVWKLDRIARSLFDLLAIVDALQRAECSFRSLTEPLDTTTPIGMFTVQVLGAVAQLERAMIRERCIAGQLEAYRAGVRWGGKLRKLSDADVAEVQRLRATGAFTIALLASVFEVSESTICRALGSRKSKPKLPVLGPLLGPGEWHQ